MNRSIPFVLSLALLGPAAFAAEEAAQPAGSPDQAAGAQDQPGADAAQPEQADASGEAAAATQDPSATATDDQAQAAAGKEAGQQQDPTQMFIKDMYSHNLYEVQLSQWVREHAQDDQIKQLADMLIKDHQEANEQLKQVAQSAGAQLDEQLDPVHQAKLEKFQQLPQAEVVRKFANDQVAGHMVSVLELTYQSQNAQDQQVKQFATSMLPKMEQHLDHVTKFATQQAGGAPGGGEAQTASERQPAEGADQPGQDAAGQSGTDAAGQTDAAGEGSQQQ